VADVFAFNADDIREFHSAMHTRAAIDRLFPRVGEAFMTNRRRPILVLRQDDTPGTHDMLIAPCDAERYRELAVEGSHASCKDNLQRAMRALGYADVHTPQPINLFMNVPVDDGGSLRWEPPQTSPGDSVTLSAAMDLILVVSACPQDIVPVNDHNPTSLAVELLEDGADPTRSDT
jgi:uncharacterized protein YcgI (DUF1989 family)